MNIKEKAATLINFVFFIALFGVIFILMRYAITYLVPLIISFVIVYLLQKPTIVISRRTKIPKNILTLVLLLIILLTIGFIVYFLFIKIIDLFTYFPINGESIEYIFTQFCGIVDGISDNFPDGLKRYTDIDSESVISGISQYVSDFTVGLVENTVSRLPSLIFSVVISIVSACFLAFDYDRIIKFIKRQLSNESIKFMRKLKKVINFSLFNLFRGYLILMLLTFTEIFLGLTLIGVKKAVAISLLIAFVDMLPVFGTGIILVPWSIFSLLIGNATRGVYLIILYAVCAVVRYFIEPKIIGKNVGMSPFIALLAMFIGLRFFGITGLFVFPLITSIILILHKNGLIKLWK